ncbi:hypothetical protein GCK72_008728 [Caenorhabditis remanei]|uniref:Uncharacterized protein n=1 Tax=Caenorhabditis remanei TaxID=31234 RepID=A0A6A5H0F8_CAERE|nr:hypothetical protein GCK72_008728 [Caenorhabditis remanei]KAF1760479.1 hypothetical protein GCK72_008728 [Caenorhabditis remanei]
MSSEFPLFRLPLIVLNHGLKLMTPFEIDHIAGEEKLMRFYVPMEDGCFGFRPFINHLSFIFNITLTDLELHFQDFTQHENEIIIDLYCGNTTRNTNYAKNLTLVGESVSTPGDDELVNHILNRQEAECELTLDMQSFTFNIRRSQFRYIPNQLVIRNSSWVSSIDIEYFNSFSVLIFSAHSIMWWWHLY